MITIGIYGIQDRRNRRTETGRAGVVHDHNLTILQDGRLLSYTQLERMTGKKHDSRLEEYIEDILSHHSDKIKGQKVSFVSANSFLGNNFKSSEKRLKITLDGSLELEKIMQPVNLELEPPLKNFFPNAEAYVISHEMAHIGTNLPFFGRFNNNSLLIHIDGGASASNSSSWFFDGNEITHLNHSWTDLKDVVNNYNDNPLVFFILGEPKSAHLSIPGKLMGYASYGRAKSGITEWLRANNWFQEYMGEKQDLLYEINRHFGTKHTSFNLKENVFKDIAACVQKSFEEKILQYIMHFKEKTGAEYLYYSGGAALNIKTNSRIERELGFRRVFIPPCCNDSGLSLGAAYYFLFAHKTKFSRIGPFINGTDKKRIIKTTKDSFANVCKIIKHRGIIGICNGAGETGPRALGHRSIVARPDDIDLAKKVSQTIKGREWYRPIAPIMTDDIAEIVLQGYKKHSCLPKYMLGEYSIRDEYSKYFAGVIHVDNSTRAQVVCKNDKDNRYIYALLTILKNEYKILGLINTSFNERGKPIVQTTEEAIEKGEKMGLNGVICDGILHTFR